MSTPSQRLESILQTLNRCISHSDNKKVCRKLVRTCDLFWCSLKSSVYSINATYVDNENKCRYCFEMINIHVLRDPRSLTDPKIQEVIGETMLIFSAFCEDWKEKASGEDVALQMEKMQEKVKDALERAQGQSGLSKYVAELRKFFDVCLRLDCLRRFVVSRYIFISSAMESFENITNVKCKEKYLKTVEEEPFYASPMLARLHTSMECLAGYITCSHCVDTKKTEAGGQMPAIQSFLGSTPNYMCPICESVLKHPVILPCYHRFCLCCLETVHEGSQRCPVCCTGRRKDLENLSNNKRASPSPEKNKIETKNNITSPPIQVRAHEDPNSHPNQHPYQTHMNKRRKVEESSSSFSTMAEEEKQSEKCSKWQHLSGREVAWNIKEAITRVTCFHLQCCSDTMFSPPDPPQKIHHLAPPPPSNGRPPLPTQVQTSNSDVVNPGGYQEKKEGCGGRSEKVKTNFDCLRSSNCSAVHMPQLTEEHNSQSPLRMDDDWMTFLKLPDIIHDPKSTEDEKDFFAKTPTTKAIRIDSPPLLSLDPNPIPEHTDLLNTGSCHQCKLKFNMTNLVKCTTKQILKSKEGLRSCRKKFCRSCLLKKYHIHAETIDTSTFKCPACRGICTCAQCMRSSEKAPRWTTVSMSTQAGNTESLYMLSKKRKSLSARSEGGDAMASCHQCKIKKHISQLRPCSSRVTSRHGRKCRKKYCKQCLGRYGDSETMKNSPEPEPWPCPACRKICTCAQCKKRRAYEAELLGI
ncbi:hypothetical protein AAMO2058_001335400 [Amorphochlora amoebiformis]